MPTRVAIGVDLGGTKLLAGVVGAHGGVRRSLRVRVGGLDRAGVVRACAEAVEALRDGLDGDAALAGVGFGIPCLVDRERGVAVTSVHLPLADVPFRDLLAERLALPVAVDNDANCALLAELRLGAARGAREVVLLTLGTGIGGGLAFGGRLHRGATGAGAELGHVVVDFDGPPCQGACPSRGCLEALASGSALVREAAAAAARAPASGLGRAWAGSAGGLDGPEVTRLALAGDAAALDVVALIGTRLGVGIASLVNALNPERVVVGGGVIEAGELLLGPAREEMLARALAPSRDQVRLRAAELGPGAGMVGAALMALEPGG